MDAGAGAGAGTIGCGATTGDCSGVGAGACATTLGGCGFGLGGAVLVRTGAGSSGFGSGAALAGVGETDVSWNIGACEVCCPASARSRANEESTSALFFAALSAHAMLNSAKPTDSVA